MTDVLELPCSWMARALLPKHGGLASWETEASKIHPVCLCWG